MSLLIWYWYRRRLWGQGSETGEAQYEIVQHVVAWQRPRGCGPIDLYWGRDIDLSFAWVPSQTHPPVWLYAATPRDTPMSVRSLYSSEVPKLWGASPRGARARVVCMRDIPSLNEIWTQDKIYILVGTLLG
jgi:hypothetical protein